MPSESRKEVKCWCATKALRVMEVKFWCTVKALCMEEVKFWCSPCVNVLGAFVNLFLVILLMSGLMDFATFNMSVGIVVFEYVFI